jgi:hypothetical protein
MVSTPSSSSHHVRAYRASLEGVTCVVLQVVCPYAKAAARQRCAVLNALSGAADEPTPLIAAGYAAGDPGRDS